MTPERERELRTEARTGLDLSPPDQRFVELFTEIDQLRDDLAHLEEASRFSARRRLGAVSDEMEKVACRRLLQLPVDDIALVTGYINALKDMIQKRAENAEYAEGSRKITDALNEAVRLLIADHDSGGKSLPSSMIALRRAYTEVLKLDAIVCVRCLGTGVQSYVSAGFAPLLAAQTENIPASYPYYPVPCSVCGESGKIGADLKQSQREASTRVHPRP